MANWVPKTTWSTGQSVYPADVNRWEQGITDAFTPPVITSPGNFGAAQTLTLSGTQEQWLVGTLSADLTVTVSNIVAGSSFRILATQGSTPRTITLTDGTTPQVVPVPTTAGAQFEIVGRSFDGATIRWSVSSTARTVRDEGVGLPTRSVWDFVGSGVVVSDDAAGDRTIITVNAFFTGVFGDGSDGVVALDGTTAIPGMTLSGSTYTMTRDINATTFYIGAGISLRPSGFRIRALTSFTNDGTISYNGANGIAGTVAAAGTHGFLSQGTGGGGGTGVGTIGVAGIASTGGSGGTGASGAGGGSVALVSSVTAAQINALLRDPALIRSSVWSFGGNAALPLRGGSGGSGGGGDGAGAASGGNGGGIIAIFSPNVTNNGTVSATGGNGGSTAAGNRGSGGGGGGGLFITYTRTPITDTGTTTLTGGTAGTPTGTGTSGASGGTGVALNVVLG